MKNITERYDGYGNSIRKVMSNKDKVPGLLGVVADIIKVEKEYEIAVETALGGSIREYCNGYGRNGEADDPVFETEQVRTCNVSPTDRHTREWRNPK